jgi:hypothetical protein
MQGWIKIDLLHFKDKISALVSNFLEIEHLIDNNFANFKQPKNKIKG